MSDRLSNEQIATLRALAEQATPGPWAYEATAEKSNDWAVGQAFDEHGHPLSGRLDTSVEWLEDRIITRRLIGESEDAPRLADAAYIAAANPAVLLALLIEMQEWRTALDDLHVSHWIGVVDGLTPREAVRKLLDYALDQNREALRDELARALAEVQASRRRETGPRGACTSALCEFGTGPHEMTECCPSEREDEAYRRGYEAGQRWQPIATAPKNTRVLVGGGNCPRVHENELRCIEHGGCAWLGLGDNQQPTLWMPMPATPSEDR